MPWVKPLPGSKQGRSQVEGTGVEIRPAMVSGIVTGHAPVSYWPIFFFPVPSKVPEVFAKINPAQFPSVASRVAGSRATECSPEGI